MSAQPYPCFTCCYCARAMCAKRPGDYHRPDAATRDHILPKALGGTLAADNVRICCQRCNELRAKLGHCTGPLLCFLACMPEPSTTSLKRVARVWRSTSPLFEGLPR